MYKNISKTRKKYQKKKTLKKIYLCACEDKRLPQLRIYGNR